MLDEVTKLFGQNRAVDRASFTVERGEVFTLLGPSGCGKTTTLRMVAGLERPNGGRIVYRGEVVSDPGSNVFVPPNKRNVGMVFQSYAIWPHMTVFGNVAYPLRIRGVPAAEVRDRVHRVLELVGMAGLEDRPAPLLSGGQQQRVALCRALVYEPDLLLLDEPFSNLDAKLRAQMRVEVRLLQRKLGISVLMVTHDQVEALSMSDRIAVMNLGRVEQVGPPVELYDRPASTVVRDFLGQVVTLRGHVAAAGGGRASVAVNATPREQVTLFCENAGTAGDLPVGSPAYVAVRPEDIVVEPCGNGHVAAPGSLPATIEALLFVGDRYEARVALANGESILLFLNRSQGWHEGQAIQLVIPPEKAHVWPA